ncbi:hypothetical protein [Ascidiimonas aurantiaca]
MNTKRFLFAVAFVAAFLFVSCSPNSVADEDSLYDKQGVEKSKIKVTDVV